MRKGYKAEWELFHLLWQSGYAVARVAGSGSSSMPACDLIAGNGKEKLAIEVKACRNDKKYIEKKQLQELIEFAKIFGLKPVVFVKFFRKGWYVFDVKNLKQVKNFFVADIKSGKPWRNEK
jgi:Holliday junction resolvase